MRENLFNRDEMALAWEGFKPGNWSEEIDVRDFIQKNYEPYYGDASFWKAQVRGQPGSGKQWIG